MADCTYSVCSRCGEEKPSDKFSPDRRASNGLQSACRECCRAAKKARRDANLQECRARERAYVKANKGRVYARNNSWRNRNPGKVKAGKKAWYEAVKDDPGFLAKRDARTAANEAEKRAYDRAYRAANHEKCLDRAKAWQKANPEKRAAILRNYRDRRRSQTEGGVSTKSLVAWTRSQKKVCYWCDDPCPKGFHVDHYEPLSRGGAHELSNLVIACASCNLKKNAKDPLDFAKEVGRLV